MVVIFGFVVPFFFFLNKNKIETGLVFCRFITSLMKRGRRLSAMM